MLKDAIPLQVGFELLVQHRRFLSPLGEGCQVLQILQQLLVVTDREHDGSLLASLVSEVLQSFTHARKITPLRAFVEAPNAHGRLPLHTAAVELCPQANTPFHPPASNSPGVTATSCTQATTPNVPTPPKCQPVLGQIYGLTPAPTPALTIAPSRPGRCAVQPERRRQLAPDRRLRWH